MLCAMTGTCAEGRATALAAAGVGAVTLLAASELVRLRRVPRLPETAVGLDRLVVPGATVESTGSEPVAVSVLGDSLVAGVGVPVAAAALPVRLAEAVADDLGRAVRLRVYGRTGSRAIDVLRDQVPQLGEAPPPDVVVVSVGINDATKLAGPRVHAAVIRRIVAGARNLTGAGVVLCGVPDVRAFRALSPPVRTLVRLHATVLHRIQRRIAAETGAGFVERVPPIAHAFARDPWMMATDRYHPSPVGATVLARVAAPTVSAMAVGRKVVSSAP